jgi:hypothetical protein
MEDTVQTNKCGQKKLYGIMLYDEELGQLHSLARQLSAERDEDVSVASLVRESLNQVFNIRFRLEEGGQYGKSDKR